MYDVVEIPRQIQLMHIIDEVFLCGYIQALLDM